MEFPDFNPELDRLQGEALAAIGALRAYLERVPVSPEQARRADLAVTSRLPDLHAAASRNVLRQTRERQAAPDTL